MWRSVLLGYYEELQVEYKRDWFVLRGPTVQKSNQFNRSSQVKIHMAAWLNVFYRPR